MATEKHDRFQAVLSRKLELGAKSISIKGLDSTVPLASLVTKMESFASSGQTHLVVLPDEDSCDRFETDLSFFSPKKPISRLTTFDVSPYSELYPNRKNISQRIRWIFKAQEGSSNLFIATLEGLLQKTIEKSVFNKNKIVFRIGDFFPKDLNSLLLEMGYQLSPRVEDAGHYSFRGGIIDIFSPSNDYPTRIELFGDQIDSIRQFDSETQRSIEKCEEFVLLPVREFVFNEDTRSRAVEALQDELKARDALNAATSQFLHDIAVGRVPSGVDFLLPYFSPKLSSPMDFFEGPLNLWLFDEIELQRQFDLLSKNLYLQFDQSQKSIICPRPDSIYNLDPFKFERDKDTKFSISRLQMGFAEDDSVELKCLPLGQQKAPHDKSENSRISEVAAKIIDWRSKFWSVLISVHTHTQAVRLQKLLNEFEITCSIVESEAVDFAALEIEQDQNITVTHILIRPLSQSVILPEERRVYLREEDFFGGKAAVKRSSAKLDYSKNIQFADLNPGDWVVHEEHGVGVFEKLVKMKVNSIEAEFVQLKYKDNDKLYVPIYRIGQIQKFSGVAVIDKLGGNSWQKTKIKVKSHLKDIASELLQLYAQRNLVARPPFEYGELELQKFESLFPFDETEDQNKAIQDVLEDFSKSRPMDRLICGDVGFGKTEVALRAAFCAVKNGQQVVVLVPTTILALQHLETFKKRFAGWPFRVEGLSRFTDKKASLSCVEGLKDGSVSIVIGTHRLLSKDVFVKNLGLLVIDEEQKFGVTHKEKIKKLKVSVDTLTLSATPIPRTLNMSLMGLRDLSLIHSAPISRLPTRTFVCKYEKETIKRAITSEVQRGGQVFFLHNRVQSIYEKADELRALLPEIKIAIGHGQLEESELEKTMLSFYKKEFDVLLCTTIIESGLDIPNANTILIDRADTFGLSQLYQLRGRVGRSKERAYCYLLIPPSGSIDPLAQERLKAIQENSSLGSGLKIAHHDLELRGAGNILGESQSGHINAVGYELYLELLENALQEAKGIDTTLSQIEPDMNLLIPALIPDSYIEDIRIRLMYYKKMSSMVSEGDLDNLESELRDQFGPPPVEVLNLLGVMLIRKVCKDMGIRDLSSTKTSISLAFVEKTPIRPETIVGLATRESKKYQITPDNRLIVRLKELNWPVVYEELQKILNLSNR